MKIIHTCNNRGPVIKTSVVVEVLRSASLGSGGGCYELWGTRDPPSCGWSGTRNSESRRAIPRRKLEPLQGYPRDRRVPPQKLDCRGGSPHRGAHDVSRSLLSTVSR
jgi:hypothetical protein